MNQQNHSVICARKPPVSQTEPWPRNLRELVSCSLIKLELVLQHLHSRLIRSAWRVVRLYCLILPWWMHFLLRPTHMAMAMVGSKCHCSMKNPSLPKRLCLLGVWVSVQLLDMEVSSIKLSQNMQRNHQANPHTGESVWLLFLRFSPSQSRKLCPLVVPWFWAYWGAEANRHEH